MQKTSLKLNKSNSCNKFLNPLRTRQSQKEMSCRLLGT